VYISSRISGGSLSSSRQFESKVRSNEVVDSALRLGGNGFGALGCGSLVVTLLDLDVVHSRQKPRRKQ
jgi:hypothetical protein